MCVRACVRPRVLVQVSPTPTNIQQPGWSDTFAVRLEGTSTLIVRRTDTGTGWDQPLELDATPVELSLNQTVTAVGGATEASAGTRNGSVGAGGGADGEDVEGAAEIGQVSMLPQKGQKVWIRNRSTKKSLRIFRDGRCDAGGGTGEQATWVTCVLAASPRSTTSRHCHTLATCSAAVKHALKCGQLSHRNLVGLREPAPFLQRWILLFAAVIASHVLVGLCEPASFCRDESCCLLPSLLPIAYLWDFVSPPRLPAM
jgi:hypothetical protein